MSAEWQVLLMTNHGHHSWATFDRSPLCDTSSNEGHFPLLCQIWPTSAAWYATLISHWLFFWMPLAWVSQPTLPTWPLSPRGPISRELLTKFSSSTTSWLVSLGASKPIPYPPSRLSIWDIYVPNSFMPPRSFSNCPTNPLPSFETLPTKWESSVWSRLTLRPFVSFLISRMRWLWTTVSTMETTCPRNCYPKPIGKISKNPMLVLWFPTFLSPTLGKFYPMATSVTMKSKQNSFIWALDMNHGQHCQRCCWKTGQHP